HSLLLVFNHLDGGALRLLVDEELIHFGHAGAQHRVARINQVALVLFSRAVLQPPAVADERPEHQGDQRQHGQPDERFCHSKLRYSSPISARGLSRLWRANWWSNSLVSSLITFGKVILTSTYWSPRTPPARKLGAPRSRRRNFCPDCVPGGTLSSALPSTVGTSIFAPSAASGTVIGTTQ